MIIAWGNRFSRVVRSSLRLKLTLIYTVGVGLLSLAIYLQIPNQIYRNVLTETVRQAQDLATITAYSVAPAVIFQDSLGVKEVISASMRGNDVAYVVVTDKDGRILGSDHLGSALDTDYKDASTHRHEIHGLWHTAATIYDTNRAVHGRVYLAVSLDRIKANAQKARSWIGMLSIFLLVGGAIAVYFISAWLTAPLGAVAAAAERIAAGDLTARAVSSTRDEVSILSQSFNTMVEKLTTAHEQLREANQGLEERVEIRTAQLRHEERERSKAEAAMIESDLRFRTIFESSALGVALFDTDGALIEGNAALQRMLGRQADTLGISFNQMIAPDDAEMANSYFQQIVAGQQRSVQLECALQTADARQCFAHLALSAVSYSDTKAYVIAMVEDNSEQRQLEELYRQSQKLEAVGQLAGGIAHDFNNILTTINGTCDLLLSDVKASTSQFADIRQIQEAGQRAARLTRQLLAFSRKQVLQPADIDANAVVIGISDLLSRLVGEDIQVLVKTATALPCVRADKSQLEQVLMNLAVNAKDAMPNGGTLKIETSARTLTEAAADLFGVCAGEYVELLVSDNGTGMDDVTRTRIFEPFFTTKNVGQGTGLGLATVYGIVQQSGGGVRVQSAPGAGTTFRVVLPAQISAVPAAEEGVLPEPARGSGTILIVEDEDTVRSLFVRVMQRAGYDVLEARHGLDALMVSEEYPNHIDLVISDVIMPRMNGPEAVKRLIVRRPSLKVLYISGYTHDVVLQKGLADKDVNYLQKPVTPSELTAAVRNILHASQEIPVNDVQVGSFRTVIPAIS